MCANVGNGERGHLLVSRARDIRDRGGSAEGGTLVGRDGASNCHSRGEGGGGGRLLAKTSFNQKVGGGGNSAEQRNVRIMGHRCGDESTPPGGNLCAEKEAGTKRGSSWKYGREELTPLPEGEGSPFFIIGKDSGAVGERGGAFRKSLLHGRLPC